MSTKYGFLQIYDSILLVFILDSAYIFLFGIIYCVCEIFQTNKVFLLLVGIYF